MYVVCLNVPHVSKLARYAREFHCGDRSVHQCTASVKTLCHKCEISLATLANSSNVQRVSKRCATRVKSRSLRSRIPVMDSKCQNAVPHVSNLARCAREFQQEGLKGQQTEP